MEHNVGTSELFLSEAKAFQVTSRQQTKFVRDVTLKQLAGFRNNCFRVGVFLLAPRPIDTSLINIIGKAVTGPRYNPKEEDLFQGGFESRKIKLRDVLKRNFFPEKEPFTISETACAFRIPSPPVEEHPGLPIKRSRTSIACLPSANLQENNCNDIELFINEHQGIVQPVRVGANDRMRHTFIIGQTGTGKSTLMERMILQDIRSGKGLAVIDPHGDMVDSVLGRMPAERADDVILFNMLDTKRPIGLNLLEWKTLEERDLIIDNLYLSLDRIYDMRAAGGPIFESNFRGMLKLLMGDEQREDFSPTILEFINCYLNSKFRNWLKDRTKDPAVRDFIKELERTGGDASLSNLAPYVTSKLSRYTSDMTLRRIVGQEKTSFDVSEVINKGKILLMKLGKGRFGPTVSALLVNQIVSQFKTAAMRRGEIKPEKRRDFFLYVDECHSLPGENFMELLSEARKFRIGLILATQYAAQLGNPGAKEDNLLSAILGNVGTLLIFRLGQTDAGLLSPALYPYFSGLDISGLPNWQGYAGMQLTGEPTPPFSFRTREDETPFDEDLARKITESSRLKYGTESKLVDARILERHKLWMDD